MRLFYAKKWESFKFKFVGIFEFKNQMRAILHIFRATQNNSRILKMAPNHDSFAILARVCAKNSDEQWKKYNDFIFSIIVYLNSTNKTRYLIIAFNVCMHPMKIAIMRIMFNEKFNHSAWMYNQSQIRTTASVYWRFEKKTISLNIANCVVIKLFFSSRSAWNMNKYKNHMLKKMNEKKN